MHLRHLGYLQRDGREYSGHIFQGNRQPVLTGHMLSRVIVKNFT